MSHYVPNRFAQKQTTGADQKASLVSLLYQCRPKALDGFVLEDLQRRHSKVDARVVEYELIRARQNRAGEPR